MRLRRYVFVSLEPMLVDAVKLIALLLLANSLLAASESYGGYPGKWVAVELHGYVAEDKRTEAGGDTRLEKHRYGVAAAQVEDGVASWNALPLGARVIVPRGHGYLDGDTEYHDAAQRVFFVDDIDAGVTAKVKATQRMHLGVRCVSQAAADRLKGKRVRVFVVDP